MTDFQSPAIVRASSLERDPMKKDFRLFQQKMWITLFGNPPSDIIYDMGWRLQWGPPRDIIMGFRGASKSFSTVGYGLWSLHLDPHETCLTLSGSDTGAKGNAVLAFLMVNTFEWLAHLKPGPDQRQSSQAFDVPGARANKAPSFAAMSLFGQVTGGRASLAVGDDVETPNTSETAGDRARLEARWAEVGGAMVLPQKEGGRVKMLGTAQTEETLYRKLVMDKGYGIRIWPAEFPIRVRGDTAAQIKADEWRKFGPLPSDPAAPQIGAWLAPMIARRVIENEALGGTPTEPTRFDDEELFLRKQEYGATEYARQFKMHMDAGASDAKPLRLRDIPVVSIQAPSDGKPLMVPGEMMWSPLEASKVTDVKFDALTGDQLYWATGVGLWGRPEKVSMLVDPSGTGDDETSATVLAEHLGRAGLLDYFASLDGFSRDTLLAIARLAKLWGVHEILIEKNFGGGMFGDLLRPVLQEIGHPCTVIDEATGSAQKELRIIDSLESLVTSHLLYINHSVLKRDFEDTAHLSRIEEAKRRFYRLTYQLTRIERTKGCLPHDDRLDSLAAGCRNVTQLLRRMTSQAAEEARDAELREVAEHMIEVRQQQGLPLFGAQVLKAVRGGLRGSPLFRGRK